MERNYAGIGKALCLNLPHCLECGEALHEVKRGDWVCDGCAQRRARIEAETRAMIAFQESAKRWGWR